MPWREADAVSVRLASVGRKDGCAARLAKVKCGEVEARGEKVEGRREREATRVNTIVKVVLKSDERLFKDEQTVGEGDWREGIY